MALLLYDFAIFCYTGLIRIAALFQPKAAQWIDGRRGLFDALEKATASWKSKEKRLTVWVHCASLGEFEQGRPLIERLKKERPDTRILLTFFSPSGYEIRRNYAQADFVCYLPSDTRGHAKQFLDLVQPDLAVFVKYEFWIHHLQALRKRRVPALLISALFRKEQLFFKWYGGLFRETLGTFHHIFTQNESSAVLVRPFLPNAVTVAGDTRVDRVLQLAESAPSYPIAEAFRGATQLLIAGSIWPEDEALLLPFLQKNLPPDWKAVLAPHQTDRGHVQPILQALGKQALPYSEATPENASKARYLVIDNIGMLSSLYQYGTVAYIGGGFGSGIHNTLEPIAFGLPVIFGPRYQKFEEARYLVDHEGGFAIQSEDDLTNAFFRLKDQDFRQQASQTARQYILDNKGATTQIFQFIIASMPPVSL
ncbi:MAG: 3-deoxy-D-manno-octulosonic acid transferase [Saprospiraceae bacterium]|nr:3-deoxy-D-manno-octulosonic acid transferase [Saprospiraceae bacterium]